MYVYFISCLKKNLPRVSGSVDFCSVWYAKAESIRLTDCGFMLTLLECFILVEFSLTPNSLIVFLTAISLDVLVAVLICSVL